MKLRTITPILLTLGLASGCVVHGTTGAYVETDAYYTQPDLVYVSPGVQVVYDYNEPVFYSDGFYWRYYGGVWYRSGYYNRGWVRWHTTSVPTAVVRIDNPRGYVHFRGRGQARGQVYRPAPAPRARDHREIVRPAAVPAQRAGVPNGPGVRDHRDNRPRKVEKAQPLNGPGVRTRDHRR